MYSFIISNELLFCVGVHSKFHFQRCLGWILLQCGLPLFCCQVSKIRSSWSKFSRNSFYTRREFGKCSQPFFHYSSHYGMMGDHLAIELQWLKHASSLPILQVSLLLNVSLIWHCDLDTWVGIFKCLATTSRTSQPGLSQDCLPAYLGTGGCWGGVVQGSWHASGSQERLLWVKSQQQEILHIWFWLLYWAGLCSSLRC